MHGNSKYTPEIAEYICTSLVNGKSLKEICEQEGIPDRSTILRWTRENEDFAARCGQARIDQADYMDDRILEVANNVEKGDIAPDAARVAISALQWRASKLKPNVYGDRTILAGDRNNPLELLAVRLDRAVTARTMIDVTPIARSISNGDDASDLL